MSAKDRAAVINKLYKHCKKNYEFTKPPSDRSVLEHLMYACCLEDSTFEAADEALAKLQENFYDWNEVRVTTRVELASICKNVTDPEAAASRLKKTLHCIFETWYNFELDFLKKENLGKTTQALKSHKGVTPFVISYVAQHGLGGHSIPLDESMLMLFHAVGAISEDEMKKGKVPGLERTIPKSKGIEFSAVCHHLAVAYHKHPHKKETREEILTIAPDARERFPKRGAAKRAEAAAKKAAEEAVKKEAEEKAAAEQAKKEAEKAKKEAEKAKKAAARKKEKEAEAKRKAAAAKKVAAKKSVKKKVAKKAPVKKKAAKKKAGAAAKKKRPPVKKKITKKKTKAATRKSPTKRLKKKKPR